MAINKNALIRYKTIDNCLQNRYRKWTLDDLIEACSEALYEYEGKKMPVSKRTVQLDIQNMRYDKLGYNAPIIVVDKKYYTYEDPNYSITNLPISSQDLEKLSESVALLKQFRGFSHFDELSGLIQKLEDHVYAKKMHTKPVIDFEKNENLKGLNFLDPLYRAIIQRQTIHLTYQSFKARNANTFVFHPYLLKEFRNRWFIFGQKDGQRGIVNLALDRIVFFENSNVVYKENTTYDFENFFDKAIGVSINVNQKPETVLLAVSHKNAPYILTKPLHSSQKMIERNAFGIIISLEVQHNFELEKEILSFGEAIKVISPPTLKRKISERLSIAFDNYETEISTKSLKILKKKLKYKGSTILNAIYSKREIKGMRQQINFHFKERGKTLDKIPNFLKISTKISSIILNANIQSILTTINPNYELINSNYYHSFKSFKLEQWQQNTRISKAHEFAIVRIHLEDTLKQKGIAKVIHGTQNKILNKSEIKLIVENSIPIECHINSGGIHIYHPLLLSTQTSTSSEEKCEIIELWIK